MRDDLYMSDPQIVQGTARLASRARLRHFGEQYLELPFPENCEEQVAQSFAIFALGATGRIRIGRGLHDEHLMRGRPRPDALANDEPQSTHVDWVTAIESPT